MGEADADVTLTEQGRQIAEEVVHCYEEVSYGGDYDSRDECKAIAQSKGLELLGSGVGRDIYAVGDELVSDGSECVLKLSANLVGCHETTREVRSYERVSDEAREYLAPVLDHDVGWLLMARTSEEVDSHEIQQLLADFHDTGWACEDTNEAHNIGKLDEQPVIIDYGRGCYQL